MKRLTLLRHAKSTWDDPVARDFDRPLNRRGRKAARRIGEEMRALGLSYDMVIASPAVRVRETLSEVEQGFGCPFGVIYEKSAYLATPETLLELIRPRGDSVGSILLVGHNPGIERLALDLAGQEGLGSELALKYPTAALAEIELPAPRWRDVAPGTGRLTRFIRPRDLDPELGPDEDSD